LIENFRKNLLTLILIDYERDKKMTKEKILKQKKAVVYKWKTITIDIKNTRKLMEENYTYCDLCQARLEFARTSCPLSPSICSTEMKHRSSYDRVLNLMESLRVEVLELMTGMETDIERIKKTPAEEKPINNLELGVKNLEKELKEKFPGIKFNLKSRKHDAPWGTAMRVSWIDGPTEKEVRSIADKYEHKNHLGGILPDGTVTYVATRRVPGHETKSRIGQLLCDPFAVKYRGNEDKPIYGVPGYKTIDGYVKKNIRDTSFDSQGKILNIDQDPNYLTR